MSTVLDTGAICSTCTITSRIAVALADQPRELLQPPALENAAQAAEHFVDDSPASGRRRRSRCARRRSTCAGSAWSASPTDGRAVPELLLHERDGRRIGELAGEDDDVRLLALERGADVVERRDERGLDAVPLEHAR